MEPWERHLSNPEGSAIPLLIVAAHPDDETVGVGGILGGMSNAAICCVTDGAPRNLYDANAAGFTTREQYAARRAEELSNAMQLAGIPESRIHRLALVDQEAACQLVVLTHMLLSLIQHLQPQIVITHPFEGGHPDHDAVAFAVQNACSQMLTTHPHPPQILEMTSYHALDGHLRTGEFLDNCDNTILSIELTLEQQRRKQQMIEAYRTQAHILNYFSTDRERLRLAPRYDFIFPPDTSPLWYENFDWGMTRGRWNELVEKAQLELGEMPVKVAT